MPGRRAVAGPVALTPAEHEGLMRRRIDLFLFESVLGAERVVTEHGTRFHRWADDEFPNELPPGFHHDDSDWCWLLSYSGPSFSQDVGEMGLVEESLKLDGLGGQYARNLAAFLQLAPEGPWDADAGFALATAPAHLRAAAAQLTVTEAREAGLIE